jgi:23S rRNA (uracil1939-C5)-methyltransferase
MKVAEEEEKTFEVEIERLLPGGVGLAHADGLTVFVSLAAPGDVLRVKIDRVQGKVGFASIVEIIKASPMRVEAPCPYFGRCGGCDFQQLAYQTQLDTKAEIIRDCLYRIAQVEPPATIRVMPSPNQWHYRTRASWQVDVSERRLGYFERGSNRVCDVEYCAVLTPELQQCLEKVRHELTGGTAFTGPRTIDAVVGDDGISVAPPAGGFSPGVVRRRIGDETYSFNAESFFQVNHELVEPLIAEALNGVRGQFAVDLYCGVGLFTLPLARHFAQVTAVEEYAPATDFARRNLAEAKIENVEVVTLDVAHWLKHSRPFEPLDFLLLDPPRVGCENAAIAGILGLRPRRIAYVSCDPATLARDLKKLIADGYSLDSVAAFDMFPQTHHVETVAHLTATRQL